MGCTRIIGLETSYKYHTLTGLLLVALVVAVVYITADPKQMLKYQIWMQQKRSPQRCDLLSGKWVFDNNSYPLYKEKQCTYMPPDYTCEKNGRKEFKFQHWRWQPHYCDLPRSLFLDLSLSKSIYIGADLEN